MYYNRTLSKGFADLFMDGGPLRWLIDYVRSNSDLDFQLRRNEQEEWASIYRRRTQILGIKPSSETGHLTLFADDAHKEVCSDLYGNKAVTSVTHVYQSCLDKIRDFRKEKGPKDFFYENKKEGYYQHMLARDYGILSNADSIFVIVDREAVPGYDSNEEKQSILGSLKERYNKLKGKVGQNCWAPGDELDLLALDKTGNILLIECKHHDKNNSQQIYQLPLQVGFYHELLSSRELEGKLQEGVLKLLSQKQELGLISRDWKVPALSGKIIPMINVSEPNYKSRAYDRLSEILNSCRKEKGQDFLKELRAYGYTEEGGLTPLTLPT